VLHLHVAEAVEIFGREERSTAGAGRCIVEIARTRSGDIDEIAHRLRGHGRMHRRYERARRDERERREIGQQVVRQLFI
jgi:hypothetical protein